MLATYVFWELKLHSELNSVQPLGSHVDDKHVMQRLEQMSILGISVVCTNINYSTYITSWPLDCVNPHLVSLKNVNTEQIHTVFPLNALKIFNDLPP